MTKLIFTLMFVVSLCGVFSVQTARAVDPDEVVAAEATADSVEVVDKCRKSFLGLPHWYEYLELDSNCTVVGPCVNEDDGSVPPDCKTADSSKTRLDVTKTATRVAMAIIDILMRVGGMVAFGFIVYSGFRFVMSAGNPDQEKAARETAINALIGMVITIFAVAIVSYIGRRLAGS